MAESEIHHKLRYYQATALFSIVFALLGFSYNVWRMEVSEHNSSVRSASFELVLQLAELEQLVYAAHYDHDEIAGNPRKGWVKVGLIVDLSMIGGSVLQGRSAELKTVWSAHWDRIDSERESAEAVVSGIDGVREEVHRILASLD